jgi:arginyl-tRNA synthetase
MPILPETDLQKKIFRVQLSQKVAQTVANAFAVLGILVPDKM